MRVKLRDNSKTCDFYMTLQTSFTSTSLESYIQEQKCLICNFNLFQSFISFLTLAWNFNSAAVCNIKLKLTPDVI